MAVVDGFNYLNKLCEVSQAANDFIHKNVHSK